MSFIASFRITTKVVAVVGLLSAIAIVITGIAFIALGELSRATDRMQSYSDRAILAEQVTVGMLAIANEQYRLVADPRPEVRAAVETAIRDEMNVLTTRL